MFLKMLIVIHMLQTIIKSYVNSQNVTNNVTIMLQNYDNVSLMWLKYYKNVAKMWLNCD